MFISRWNFNWHSTLCAVNCDKMQLVVYLDTNRLQLNSRGRKAARLTRVSIHWESKRAILKDLSLTDMSSFHPMQWLLSFADMPFFSSSLWSFLVCMRSCSLSLVHHYLNKIVQTTMYVECHIRLATCYNGVVAGVSQRWLLCPRLCSVYYENIPVVTSGLMSLFPA